MSKKESLVEFQVLNSCWICSLIWTFGLVDLLQDVYLGKSKITDLEESKTVLSESKIKLNERKDR